MPPIDPTDPVPNATETLPTPPQTFSVPTPAKAKAPLPDQADPATLAPSPAPQPAPAPSEAEEATADPGSLAAAQAALLALTGPIRDVIDAMREDSEAASRFRGRVQGALGQLVDGVYGR